MVAEFDCVIVGAGMVGATAAVMLNRRGLRVALIEHRPAPAATSLNADVRALVLSPASARILDDAGLWSRLQPLAEPIRTIHVNERGRFGAVRLHAHEVGLDALGWACPADGLLQALVAGAQAGLGDALAWSTRYSGHRETGGGAVLTAERDGAPLTLTARLVIAADGAESDVRAAAGIAVDSFDYAQDAIVANVGVAAPRAHTAFERFTRRGPLALIPRGGTRYVAVQCLDRDSAQTAMALDDEDYLALLERRFGRRLGSFSELGPRHLHALIRRRAARVTGPRLVLIGNAANTVHPNAAQGLNLGLRDVQALVHLLAPGDDVGAPATLARYAALRARDQRDTVGFTDMLAQTFRSPLAVMTCARRVALAATACLPPLRRRLIVEASGLAALARMQDA